MENITIDALRRIGGDLDIGIWPSVLDGGLVAPNEVAVTSTSGAEANFNEHRQRDREGPPKGETGGTPPSSPSPWARATGEAASLISASGQASFRDGYEEELGALDRAYPGTHVWRYHDGLWLLSNSSVLSGLGRAATFLTGISFETGVVKAWGFWTSDAASVKWIGPRHTNFPDGSVCAFAPIDRTWVIGDRLIDLLDLYSLWALRQLHLETFKRWPGPQLAFHAYERLLECHEDEHCGCGSSLLYRDCCLPRDLGRQHVSDCVNFLIATQGGIRFPPNSIVQVILASDDPPPLARLLA